MGVCGCLWMCAGVQGGARGARCGCVWPGVAECAQVGTSVRECALVYAGVCGSTWVSTSVCVMNSQNNYWRIESLHQRTLIRILYEFFLY